MNFDRLRFFIPGGVTWFAKINLTSGRAPILVETVALSGITSLLVEGPRRVSFKESSR